MATADRFGARATACVVTAVLLGCVLAYPGTAAAQTRHITATLPDFSGPTVPAAPFPTLTVGTFTYTLLPGETILRATVSGTWGNTIVPSSAAADLVLDGVLVAQCFRTGTCWSGVPTLRQPWSFTFSPSQFPLLADGSAVLIVRQTSETNIRLGSLSLDLEISSPRTLTVTGAGTGIGTVTSQAGLVPVINCAISIGVAIGACQQTYPPAPTQTTVTLTATPGLGSTFAGWSGSCTGTGTCVLPMTQARAARASFTTLPPQLLTVTRVGGGTVTSVPAGIDCGTDCTESYPLGTPVTLTALPAADYTFTGWSGACTGTLPCVVQMTSARAVTATFSLNRYTLTVNRVGSGTVTSLPAGINCGVDCSEDYDSPTPVTLTAVAAADYTFTGWSGACTGTLPCVVQMTSARAVTATFAPPETLTVNVAGGGLVTSVPAGIGCGTGAADCTEAYPLNTPVTLTAAADTGYTFTGWSGACTGTGTCVITVNGTPSVTATFTINRYTLTVNRVGNGAVTSNPPGITCGADCSEAYDYPTQVTLTAAPAAGWQFAAWSGAGCTGAGVCTMTADRTAVATFTQGAPTITTVSPGRGTTAGGTPVRVTGTNLLPGSTVTVGGSPATNVVVTGSTELSFVTPGGNVGAAPLVVGTAAATATSSFTYVLPAARSLAGARHPAFNFDGRYTAFESPVALVADDTNGIPDIYVYDGLLDTVHRVSISTLGTEAVGGESLDAAISASGRFVAFESRASNLVPGDLNGLADVFLHDRDADANGVFDEPGGISTTRVSVASEGTESIGGNSRLPSISGNGRWVVFESAATNLVPSDDNGLVDVFVHDRLTGQTRRLDVSTEGAQAVGGASGGAVISLDGRWVAFESAATNLVAGDTNGLRDVFLHDRDTDADGVMDDVDTQATTRISVSSSVSPPGGPPAGAQGDGDSGQPSITQEGRYIAFASTASNLVSNDTNRESDVFLHDRVAGTTVRLSVGPGGALFVGPSHTPSISANGSLLVFLTSGLNAPGSGAQSTAAGETAALTGIVAAGEDDGKTTTGTVPLPTQPQPPPASVDPVDPASNAQEPDVSGDGSQTGHTVEPVPGTGNNNPSIDIEGTEQPAPGIAAPFVSGLAPAQGPTGGGAQVNVEGGNFSAGDSVQWGSVTLAPNMAVGGSVLRVTAPPQGGLPATLAVRVRRGTEASNALTFTYQAVATSTPRVTGLVSGTTPIVGGPTSGGQAVTIQGSGFSSPTVRFGPHPATVQSSTPTSISVVTSAADVAGPVPVVVTNGDGGVAVSDGPYSYGIPIPGPTDTPAIATVQPGSGAAAGGTAVTIVGSHFGPGTTVTVGGQPATLVQVLSNATLSVVTPPGAPGPAVPLTVTVPGFAPIVAAFTYVGASAELAPCTGTDSDGDGMPDLWETQFDMASAGPTEDADGDGRTNLQECQAGTHPRGTYTRYLAEGATGSFFSTRVAIANPNQTPARVLLRFQTSDNLTVPYLLDVPAMLRRTIDIEAVPGLSSANVSTVIESDVEVVVDRTMRWDRTSQYGAHAETSVPAPALRWYLAEGATHGFFDLFYLIQNPSLTDTASVHIRFLRGSGDPVERDYTVPPSSRFTLSVDGIPGLEAADVSAVIDSTNAVPIIVERAMYSSAAGVFAAGHDSAGVTHASTQWFLAEGATGTYFDLFILFANPNDAAAEVQATYLLPGGTTVVKNYTIPGNRRVTIYVAAEDPLLADAAVSTKILSTNAVPIIVERSMWWPHGQAWFEAHNSPGSTVTGTKWAVADGEVGMAPQFAQTYLLVANTSSFEGHLVVTILPEIGPALTKSFTVPGNSRFNVPVGPEFPMLTPGARFSAIVESVATAPATPAEIVVERAMYWNANGIIWAAGSNLLATRLH